MERAPDDSGDEEGAGTRLPSAVPRGPLSSPTTVYELPDGRRCVVTFANRGGERLQPVRDAAGALWVGFLLEGDREPDAFDDWQRAWVAPELLRPVGGLGS